MGGCSAENCSNHSRNKHRMFGFPTDPVRRRKWAINCRRDGWMPGRYAQICSAHFEESQFEQNREDNWKKLKPTAVPTLFNMPNSKVEDAQIASDESVHEDITGDTSEWPEPVSLASASTSQHNYSRPLKRSLQSSSELTNEVAIKCQTDQDDRFDIFGKSIAIKLRDLPKQQRLIAEKLINETLFEAEMNNLTVLHKLTCQPKAEPY